ncbi:MAG: 2-oxoisovalerate dehydrogenase E1 component [Sphingobacteriales bacterium]|jgi:2-oxoisovalerate dehydrogenase E1 component
MNFNSKGISNAVLIQLYEYLLKPRLVEEKMLNLLRQGKISKWFSGIGQEAIAVGTTAAMEKDEYILPMHRNLGVFTTRDVPLEKLFKQFQGKYDGFTKGRDRSFHFGANEFHIVGMISHLGPQLAVADGISLANKLDNNGKSTLVFSGEGGTSEGDFHEALNVAAVWDLPVIFVVENNGYGLSTPTLEQFRCKNIADKAKGFGMKGITIDGNNILEVYKTIKDLRESMVKNPAPVLVECMTFRMRGHEEASGTKYVPQQLMDEWAKKDPLNNFETFLLSKKIITKEFIEEKRNNIKIEINEALDGAHNGIEPLVASETELNDVYMPFELQTIEASEELEEMRLIDAISDSLRENFRKHENLLLMGQDVAEYGGVFKITEGFVEEFGKDRIRNTPICESAIIGAALGLSIKGKKSIVEMQFADFVTCGFNQIINNLAKSHYRWEQNADVVVRMPTGAGVGAGPFHSQSNEAWFFHTPGLKIAYPAYPADAKGLLSTAIEDPNPVLFFEHKALYRSIRGMVPKGNYTIPFGEASICKQGEQLTIVTYGMGVHWAMQFQAEHPEKDLEIIDLRTLMPWDKKTVEASVKKTNKVLILHEDTLIGGIGGEISAWINEHCFTHLDAPVMRCASIDTPIPMHAALEANFLAQSRLGETIEKLLNY